MANELQLGVYSHVAFESFEAVKSDTGFTIYFNNGMDFKVFVFPPASAFENWYQKQSAVLEQMDLVEASIRELARISEGPIDGFSIISGIEAYELFVRQTWSQGITEWKPHLNFELMKEWFEARLDKALILASTPLSTPETMIDIKRRFIKYSIELEQECYNEGTGQHTSKPKASWFQKCISEQYVSWLEGLLKEIDRPDEISVPSDHSVPQLLVFINEIGIYDFLLDRYKDKKKVAAILQMISGKSSETIRPFLSGLKIPIIHTKNNPYTKNAIENNIDEFERLGLDSSGLESILKKKYLK